MGKFHEWWEVRCYSVSWLITETICGVLKHFRSKLESKVKPGSSDNCDETIASFIVSFEGRALLAQALERLALFAYADEVMSGKVQLSRGLTDLSKDLRMHHNVSMEVDKFRHVVDFAISVYKECPRNLTRKSAWGLVRKLAGEHQDQRGMCWGTEWRYGKVVVLRLDLSKPKTGRRHRKKAAELRKLLDEKMQDTGKCFKEPREIAAQVKETRRDEAATGLRTRPQTPGSQTPRSQTPGLQTPGSETPGTQTPGVKTPGTQTPSTPIPTEAAEEVVTLGRVPEESATELSPPASDHGGKSSSAESSSPYNHESEMDPMTSSAYLSYLKPIDD